MPFGFLRNALRDFPHVGSLFPSSSFACRAIARHLPAAPRVVVEYGPGSGVVTRELLTRLPHSARLIAFEINAEFAALLRLVSDQRLHINQEDIVEASGRLREWAPDGVDAVISGIPFSFLSKAARERVVLNTRDALKDGGRFIVYQNSRKMTRPLEACFTRVSCRFELRNIFPYFIMVAHK
jgi:phospholipid N-methyltransferase